jgi:hypothetical protein
MVEKGTMNRTEHNFVKLILEGAPSVEETFLHCSQKYVKKECVKLITTRSMLQFGLCYTFNMQKHETLFKEAISKDFDFMKNENGNEPEHWTLEGGYSSSTRDAVPYRSEVGSNFNFYMNVNHSDYHDVCSFFKKSFSVILHMPCEMPTYMHDSDYVLFDKEVSITLTAVTSKAEKSLRKYTPEQRGCYFQGERELQFYKTYTKRNCDYECLCNFTIKRCGCANFPHVHANSVKVCDLNETGCHIKAYNEWPEFDEASNKTKLPCNCLPSCTDIEYKIKSRQVFDLDEDSSLTLKEFKEKGW